MTRSILQYTHVYEPAINVKRDFISVNFWPEILIFVSDNTKRLNGSIFLFAVFDVGQ